ncbi:methionine--tRNA ligase subunit beta [Granulicella arctica]|uniref:methionine--tRNA ligase subunit beta n=1 Tax=Granulicella arctica TaxID=940613 RepID=UPI0021DFC0BC|nr:methionine--tRNA ligase subunit beta [Granulicella arctica]
MPATPQKFYLTTPIYYVNARPHIGHAYTTLVADTIARRHRLMGDDTFFLTGTDEHGQKIERSAAAAGIPPQAFADEVSAAFRTLWDRMGLTYNDYIRTTDPRHKQGAQKLFADLHARGQIYLSSYTGQYSIGEEMFIEGPPGTIGPDGRPTETVTEENFFFKLSEYQEKLLDLIESDTLHIQPESRKNEVLSFLRGNVAEATEAGEVLAISASGKAYVPGALRDLSVSRSSFTWGIPVPEPAASETQEKHVIYVWLDALANYMTAMGYGSEAPEDIAKFEKYWPADLHLVGKEIIRFHCVYWPAFLLAANLPLPKAVTAHGWLLFDDSKMSKSKGNIVRTETILDAFGTLLPKPLDGPGPEFSDEHWKHEQDLFATDILRYFLLREIPFGQDGSFSFKAMITRYNADLANGYGNLVSRTLAMIKSNFDGAIPGKGDAAQNDPSGWDVIDQVHKKFERYDFSGATQDLWFFLGAVDGLISSAAPWKLAKSEDPTDKLKLETVLYAASESIRVLTALLYPILPNATAKVWLQLGLGDIEQAAANGKLKDLKWGGLQPGTKLGPLGPIFPRADKGLAQIMTDIEASKAPKSTLIDELNPTLPEHHDSNDPAAGPRTATLAEPNPGAFVAGSHAVTTERLHTSHTDAPASGPFVAAALATATPDTPQIAIDDFVKIDLRVAKITIAERIPKADKLLRLEVDLGYEQRQILSGIAEWYTPEELIGRRIVIIANLAPRKMRGLESHGMLLAASSGDNTKPVLTTFPDTEDLALGSRVR